MKNIEFFHVPPGAIFEHVWKGSELSFFFRPSITLEYFKHNFKQGFWNRLLYGKLPPMICTRKYNNDYHWMNIEELISPAYSYKCFIVELFSTNMANTITQYNKIVNSCPVNTIVVFGYDLKTQGNQIVPEIYKAWQKGQETKNFHSIVCGFAGYMDISQEITKLVELYIQKKNYYILPKEGNVKPNASHINNGCCAFFAEDLIKKFPEAEYVWVDKPAPHAFVKYKGKYYDSETPNGVSSWKQLPLFRGE